MTAEMERDNKDAIRAVIKYPGRDPEVIEQANTLRGYQKVVNGYIESVPFPGKEDDMDIIMNDEGKMVGLEPNIFIPEYRDVFVGVLLAVGVTEDLTWRGLTDEEIRYAVGYFREHECIKEQEYHPERDNGIQNTIDF